jgi:hypothetical protein
MLLRVQESVREWTPTLPSELPFWELKSQWIPEFSEGNFRDQNSLDWRFPYIIENLLEHRCLKWAHMTHLGTSNISYGQKKGQESNCQFDFRPLKVKNLPDSLAWRWRVTYRWKALNEGYNFDLDLTSIKGLHAKLWDSKVARVPILGLPLGSPGTKWHLGAASLVAMHIIYYKGEGGGFPQIWAVVNLVSPCLPMVNSCTKSAPAIH